MQEQNLKGEIKKLSEQYFFFFFSFFSGANA